MEANTVDPKKILSKGLESSLANTPIVDGKLRYCTDTGRVYLDQETDGNKSRIKLSDIEDIYTEEQLSELIAPSITKIYVAKDTHRLYKYSNGEWFDLSGVLPKLADPNMENNYIWFGETNDTAPLYDKSLSYNTSTKTLKVNNVEVSTINGLKITTESISDGSKRITFSTK